MPKKRLKDAPQRQDITKYFKTGDAADIGSSGKTALADETNGQSASRSRTVTSDSDTGSSGKTALADDGQSASSSLKSDSESTKLKFLPKWQLQWNWLKYDMAKNSMYCKLCRDLNMSNVMAIGSNNFKTTTLQRHALSADHQKALQAPKEQHNLQESMKKLITKEEKAVIVCMKVVYWLAKEAVPLTKYSSLMELLSELDTPNMESLKLGQKVTYNSYTTACDLLASVSESIDNSVSEKINKSPVLTVITDESTDIAVHHKLCISATIINPVSMVPSTHFLTDLRITTATGSGIFAAIEDHLKGRQITISQVSALGTDGATVMVGRKEGLTGHFLRGNAHLVQTHCSAHRVALCSEQAAEGIPGMKYYQGIMESLFYHFKKSPVKSDKLQAVQKLLDEPTLKYREVHQVRWLSFYEALDAVYRTMDSLLTYFSTASDPKALGMKKKMGQDFFVKMTYSLMDILQPVMKLSLFFQRKSVDIGSVQPAVEACLSDLQTLLEGDDGPTASFTQLLQTDIVEGTFKGHHALVKSKYSYDTNKRNFIQSLIDNINKRFPDKQLMTAMCILGMRPITFLSKEDLAEWGNDSLKVLTDHYGKEQTHTYLDPVSKEKCVTISPPIIDADQTVKEWTLVKQVVNDQGYPRHSTSVLWGLIREFHQADFPNLLKLASLALTHPVHTSDCERAFSAQNIVTTPLRNRLSSDHCDQLMRVMIEGPKLSEFDFLPVLQLWRSKKSRLVFRK